MEKVIQIPLFEKGEWWAEHWRGMPEYESRDCMPYHTVYVHFESRADMEKFAQLIEQRITGDTKSVWYPEVAGNDFSKKKYMSEYEPGPGEGSVEPGETAE